EGVPEAAHGVALARAGDEHRDAARELAQKRLKRRASGRFDEQVEVIAHVLEAVDLELVLPRGGVKAILDAVAVPGVQERPRPPRAGGLERDVKRALGIERALELALS